MWTIGITWGLSLVASAAIYNSDDRHSISQERDPAVLLRGTAIAALPPLKALIPLAGGAYRLDQESFAQYQAGVGEPLCREERFRSEQMVKGAVGTGFLVAPQILVTAGHVIDSQERCDGKAVVFGYWNPQHRGVVPASQVYRCQSLIHAVNQGDEDYAVIRLDRPVAGVTPLPVRRQEKLTDPRVWMLGYPLGLSLKVTDGGTVTDNSHESYFRALLDTYPGNSGSPVFGPSGTVEGILVEGEITDITLRGEYPEGCWYSKVYCTTPTPLGIECDETQWSGAKVTRTSLWAPHIPHH